MSKVKLGAVPLVYPIPIVLVGVTVDGAANFTEVGDCAVMGIDPALVTISLSASHHTTKGIDDKGVFSVNSPSTQMLSLADYCGMESGRDVDKGALFEIFQGENTSAPLIADCPVGLECQVLDVVQVEHRRLFIAKVVECYVSQQFVEAVDGEHSVADLSKLDPIIYALDNRYYKIGDAIGTGYREGTSHMKS